MPQGAQATAADVDVALEEPVGEFGVMVAQMGPAFPETDAGEDHAEQLAEGQGSQIGSEQVLEVLLQLRVLLDGRGIGS